MFLFKYKDFMLINVEYNKEASNSYTGVSKAYKTNLNYIVALK